MNLQNGWGSAPGCKSWNTFVEETVSTKKPSSSGAMKSSVKKAGTGDP